MEVKFLRFLELSSEFCKEPEVYKVINNDLTIHNKGWVVSGCSGTINRATGVSSKLEQFKSQKQAEIEKAERWEEFLELKKDLKQYLEAKIKLTK